MFSDSLLRDDFDDAGYLRHILHLPDTDHEQLQLNQGIEHAQQQLRAHVSANCDALLQQVDNAIVEEQEVGKLRGNVTALSASVKRLKHIVDEPYEQVSKKVCTVQHAVEALEILRTLQKFSQLVQKTPEYVTTDLCRAARALRDMEDIIGSNVLQGVTAAEQQLEAVTKLSSSIRSKAHELFKSASHHHSAQNASSTSSSGNQQHHQQADLSTAIQCFYSLGTLNKVIANAVAENKRDFLKLLVRELDPQQMQMLSDTASSSAGSEGIKTREVIMAKLDAIVQDVILRAQSLMLLWRLLSKKKDPVTHQAFMTAIDGPAALLAEFWSTVSTHFFEKTQKLFKRPNTMLMFVAEYPRLYAMLQRLLHGAKELFVAAGDPHCGGKWLKSMTEEVEQKFVAASADRHREKLTQLTAKLSSLMPNNPAGAAAIVDVSVDPARPVLPSAVTALDPKGLLKLISQELTQYRQEPHIVLLVSKGICATLTALQQRLQDALQRLPASVPSTFGPCTASYVLHIGISNAATAVHADLTNSLHLLPAETAEGATSDFLTAVRQLRDAATSFRDLATNRVVKPMFVAALAALTPLVDDIIEKETAAHENDRLRELTNRCGSFVSRYALLLERSTPGLEEAQRQLVGSLLRRTVLHTACLRPLPTEEHWNKCLTQLPLVLSTMPHLADSDIAYWKGHLKALKSLLTVENLVSAKGVDKRLIVLHQVQRATTDEVLPLAKTTVALLEKLELEFGADAAGNSGSNNLSVAFRAMLTAAVEGKESDAAQKVVTMLAK